MVKAAIKTAAMAVLVLAGCADGPAPDTSQARASRPAPVQPAGSVAPAIAAEGLRFDGVYQSPRQRQQGIEYWDYLRFYPDGRALFVASQGTPAQIKSWFTREHVSPATGRPLALIPYRIESGRVSVMRFKAEIKPDSLLRESEASGFEVDRGDRVFSFVPE